MKFLRGVVAALVLLHAPAVFAQHVEGSSQDENIDSYGSGFLIQSPDGNLRLRPHGFVQTDAHLFDPSYPQPTTFFIRRGRLGFDAQAYGIFSVRIDGEMTIPEMKDAYLDVNIDPAFRVRAGQFKVPLGIEELTPDIYVPFAERSIINESIIAGRDIGVMAYGKLLSGIVNYQLGVFNGNGDNTPIDTNHAKDLALRVTVTPFHLFPQRWLQQLALGAGVQTGIENTVVTPLVKAAELVPFLTPGGSQFFAINNNVVETGRRTRWTAELHWPTGPFLLRAEYLSFHAGLQQDATTADFDVHGWLASASWLLTGELNTYNKPVVPLHRLDPRKGGWGAFELAARASRMVIDRGVIDLGLASGTSGTDELTLGLNWYWTALTLMRFDFVRIWFAQPVQLGTAFENAENALLMRLQMEF